MLTMQITFATFKSFSNSLTKFIPFTGQKQVKTSHSKERLYNILNLLINYGHTRRDDWIRLRIESNVRERVLKLTSIFSSKIFQKKKKNTQEDHPKTEEAISNALRLVNNTITEICTYSMKMLLVLSTNLTQHSLLSWYHDSK